MRVLLLSDINSSHTQKWARGLSQRGIDVGIFSISRPLSDWYSEMGILLLGSSAQKNASGLLSKAAYIRLLPGVKKAIGGFRPDIVHAHYASSYGFLGALSGFHPLVISAWGSDLMEFPLKNIVNREIIRYNLEKADQLLATSDILVQCIARYSEKPVRVIPFGIDTTQFFPSRVSRLFPPGSTVVGTIKSMEHIYGVDILLNAFSRVLADHGPGNLHLLIVGGGSMEAEYRELAKRLGIAEKVVFTGRVAHDEVVHYHNMIDIFVNVSRNESFGVSVIEASACGKPVIVSKVGGLTEVVEEGDTGMIVAPEDIEGTATAIVQLVRDEELRKRMGEKGRLLVLQRFDLAKNVSDTVAVYEELLRKRK